MDKNLVKTSKFLSLILRHRPDEIGLVLDENGWADVDELIRLANRKGSNISRGCLEAVVSENDKKRFTLSEDGRRIRANQGHSINVELGLSPSVPPQFLYHGTATRFLESIRVQGIHSGDRQHVHLSPDFATAITVGARHGKPVVLTILAGDMAQSGQLFFLSENGVWLTNQVPVEFIQFPPE